MEIRLKKTFIYNLFLFYNILNEVKHNSKAIAIVLSLIEFMQVSYFSFQIRFRFLWDTRLLPYISILRFFNKGFSVTDDDYKIYFFLASAFLILFFLLFLFLFYKVSQNKVNILLMKIFSTYVLVFNSILFIPYMILFLRVVDCTNNGQTQIENIACWKGQFFFYYIISIIMIVYMICFGLVSSVLMTNFIPGNFHSNNNYNTSKISSSYFESLSFFKKVILTCIFTLRNPFGNYTIWILTVIKFLLFATENIYLIRIYPFFNKHYTKIQKVYRTLELFNSSIVLIGLIIGGEFIGSMYLVLVGSISIIICQLILEKDVLKSFMNSNKKIHPENEVRKLIYLIDLFDNPSNMDNYIIARSIIILQKENDDISNHASKGLINELTQIIEDSTSLAKCK